MSLDKNQIYILDPFFYSDTKPVTGTTCSYKNITSTSNIGSSDFIVGLSQLDRNHVYLLQKRTLTRVPDFEANVLQKFFKRLVAMFLYLSTTVFLDLKFGNLSKINKVGFGDFYCIWLPMEYPLS